MTSAQMQDQMVSQVRQQLGGAAVRRMAETGGADLGLGAALEWYGADLVTALRTGDVRMAHAAMLALRALAARQ